MKKVIKGKKYNTETAKFVGSYGINLADRFARMEECLYRKRTGEYFLHGEGGPWSKYGISLNLNECCGGEEIIPLTHEEAREWAETHLSVDEYEKEFGEV